MLTSLDIDRVIDGAANDLRLPAHVRDALGRLARARAEVAQETGDLDVVVAVHDVRAGRAGVDAITHTVARALGARAGIYARAR